MKTEHQRGSNRDERRLRALALLARYPDLPVDQRNDLLQWFRKEASASDVGYISIDDELSHPYTLLRHDELDLFSLRDIAFMMLFWATIFAMVGGIGYLGN